MRHLPHAILLAGCLLLLAPPAAAQDADITFAETRHSFGELQEGKEALHVFTFENTGAAPLHLANVVPSCGCTTPEWTQDAVAPGRTGEIQVAYHTDGYPGPFEKTVAVYVNDETEPVTLYIDGDVLPRPLEQPVAQGNLLIEYGTADMGAIAHGENVVYTIRVQNDGAGPLKIEEVSAEEDNVFVTTSGRTLHPGSIDRIDVIVDTSSMTPGATFSYPIQIQTTDAEQSVKTVMVTGRVGSES